MGKSSPSVPTPPDPAKTAAAQAAANKETAIAQAQLNNVNQVTPFGNLSFEETGAGSDGTPTFTATQTLAPDQQELLDLTTQAGKTFGQTANQQLASLSERLATPFDVNQFGPAPEANEATRQATREAILARMQPDIDRDRQALETQLVNQGFERGSEAFSNQFRDFDSGVNDARLAADAVAGSEMARMFGLERSARDGAINDAILSRTQPLNETAALLSGSQVTGPNFVGTPQTGIAGTDLIGAEFGAFNAAQQNAAIQEQARQANRQGLFGLLGSGAGAAALAFSDVRLKRDITHIGQRDGMGVYQFRYVWSDDWHIGHMAQEVQRVRPDAVHEVGGFLAVDYGALA